MGYVVVFGNDHTNSIGLAHAIGTAGYGVVALIFGEVTGFVRCSRYVEKIISGHDPQDCIDALLSSEFPCNKEIPIIPGNDSAALALEKNTDRLLGHFIFGHSENFSLKYLSCKENQVNLAIAAGFNTPITWPLYDSGDIPSDLQFPCLIKPIVSCEGAKSDIRVCYDKLQLDKNLASLKFTKNVILQQFIERDYEVSILGCGLSDGNCIVPAIEYKYSLYPKDVGLESVANIQKLVDPEILEPVKSYIRLIGYVGLFSVEMMHCKNDGKFYFTEINLRNDGAEEFILKYGANLPLNHIEDLLGLPLTRQVDYHPGYYIWEMHHLYLLLNRLISIKEWFNDLKRSNGFLTYIKTDRKPFYKQFTNLFLRKLHLKKKKKY